MQVTRILVFVLTTALVTAVVYGQTQASTTTVRNIEVLSAKEAQFASVLATHYPGLVQHRDFLTIQPISVLLHNASAHPIRAFTVKWTITRQDGKSYTQFADFMIGPSDLGPGNAGLSDPRTKVMSGNKRVLDADETLLITPLFRFAKKQYAAFGTAIANTTFPTREMFAPAAVTRGSVQQVNAVDAFLKAYSSSPQVKDLSKAKEVVASIDGVVYDDDAFVGNNESKLWERYEWERNGQHDEGVSMLRWMRSGATDADLQAKLNEHIRQGQAAKGTSLRDYWLAARGREAQRLLAIFKAGGRPDLEAVSKRLSSNTRTILHKG